MVGPVPGPVKARIAHERVIVAAGGIFAIKIMIDSMKEAKVQGEIKKAAMREARKAERAAKRGQ